MQLKLQEPGIANFAALNQNKTIVYGTLRHMHVHYSTLTSLVSILHVLLFLSVVFLIKHYTTTL